MTPAVTSDGFGRMTAYAREDKCSARLKHREHIPDEKEQDTKDNYDVSSILDQSHAYFTRIRMFLNGSSFYIDIFIWHLIHFLSIIDLIIIFKHLYRMRNKHPLESGLQVSYRGRIIFDI